MGAGVVRMRSRDAVVPRSSRHGPHGMRQANNGRRSAASSTPSVLHGSESHGIVYIVTQGAVPGDYVNYPCKLSLGILNMLS